MTAAVRAAACLTLALCLAPWTATGQDQPPPRRGPGPGGGVCHADVMRLCADVRGQRGAVPSCLMEHKDELSEACRTQMEQRAERARGIGKQVQQACADELARFCPDFQPGGGGLMRCLRPHEAELSEACRAALPPRGQRGGGGGGGGGGRPAP